MAASFTLSTVPGVINLKLNQRELAAILAGLRLYQEVCDGGLNLDIWNIASDEGRVERLNAADIDTLCESINMSAQ